MIITDGHFDLSKADRKWTPIWDMLGIESDNTQYLIIRR